MAFCVVFTLHAMEEQKDQDKRKFTKTPPKNLMVNIQPLPGQHRKDFPVGSPDYITDKEDLDSPRDLEADSVPKTKGSLVFDPQELFSANSLVKQEEETADKWNPVTLDPLERKGRCDWLKRCCMYFCCINDERYGPVAIEYTIQQN